MPEKKAIQITPPNLQTIYIAIKGTSPYVQLRFSQKAKEQMRGKMLASAAAQAGKKREPRQFDDEFEESMYKMKDGSRGIPCPAFRNACIDACRMTALPMTRAKMSIFVLAQGMDSLEPIPLVKIEGTPKVIESVVRNANGAADIRTRACWDEWSCTVPVQFDGDQFTEEEVVNLFNRAGQQCGVGEGRPFSKNSAGQGLGTFLVTVVIRFILLQL